MLKETESHGYGMHSEEESMRFLIIIKFGEKIKMTDLYDPLKYMKSEKPT